MATNNPLVSRPLQIAGIISLLTAVGHTVMGQNELGPKLKHSSVEARTALKGWYQGLNYLRIASVVGPLTQLDKLILAVQASMHLFTLAGLTQVPPRVLSGLLFCLLGVGVVQR
ncbi:BZ3500_MvSof-1268-A1-R1_Chr9g10616 [Microbotryum saponariae]|uniref:BZ3500_MvSof-1268-A1-R1_Chr9g10616 protein n=1 Tax=Microbotryum saponariae TaxID=289078 RepID=A0A2X0KGB4_9BASI|nr:BZ3501_MvSof-1269-A2-R1_Chr9g10364 [Microbotryum saponariae]SDA00394.1 BZ3500_MvSof-1268-A1-R1_Chr9g10616 [Microbotryum saponariae]